MSTENMWSNIQLYIWKIKKLYDESTTIMQNKYKMISLLYIYINYFKKTRWHLRMYLILNF